MKARIKEMDVTVSGMRKTHLAIRTNGSGKYYRHEHGFERG